MNRSSYAEAAAWAKSDYPLPKWTRWTVTVLFSLLLALEGIAVATGLADTDSDAIESLVGLALTTGLITLAAWHPAIGSLLYVLIAFAMVGRMDVSALNFGLVVVAAIVAYSCSTRARIILLALTASWPWLGVVMSTDAVWLDALFVTVAVVASAGIGIAFRHMSFTMNQMAVDHEAARLEALATERRRLAGELHDIVGHGLTVVAMQSRALEFIDDDEERQRSQRAIGDAAQQTAEDMRRLLQVLHSDDSKPGSQRAATSGSLRARVSHFVDHLNGSGIRTKATWSGARELPQSIEVNLVRIAQEATTNILKHAARPGHAEFIITFHDNEVEMMICNKIAHNPTPSGRGRRAAANSSGFGLLGLAERADLFGGTFDTSVEDDTWTLRVVLPLR